MLACAWVLLAVSTIYMQSHKQTHCNGARCRSPSVSIAQTRCIRFHGVPNEAVCCALLCHLETINNLVISTSSHFSHEGFATDLVCPYAVIHSTAHRPSLLKYPLNSTPWGRTAFLPMKRPILMYSTPTTSN